MVKLPHWDWGLLRFWCETTIVQWIILQFYFRVFKVSHKLWLNERTVCAAVLSDTLMFSKIALLRWSGFISRAILLKGSDFPEDHSARGLSGVLNVSLLWWLYCNSRPIFSAFSVFRVFSSRVEYFLWISQAVYRSWTFTLIFFM